jgi:mono/diheme cytochrome c family protein
MKLSRIALAIAALSLSFLFSYAQPPEHIGDPRIRGANVFSGAGCMQCHTIRRKGGTKGPDLSGVGRRLNKAQILEQVQNGGKQMPSFADVLEQSETDDLVAFLLSCRDKKAK